MITNRDSVLNISYNTENVNITREKNVKKPFVSNNVAILYVPNAITLKPRASKEINFGISFNYADHLIPEYDLLPSFKKDLLLIQPAEEIKGTKLILTIMNQSFSNTYRLIKNTGLVVFQILNRSINLQYNQSINQSNQIKKSRNLLPIQ